jgi:hypothetical protein
MTEPSASTQHPDVGFSLVHGGPPYHLQQKLGLIPRRGLGVPRRIIVFMLLTWAPIMGWALVNEHLWAAAVSEPLLQHFGVHVRCLVAIPLLIAAEAVAEAISRRLFPYFVASGLVTDVTTPRFVEILAQTNKCAMKSNKHGWTRGDERE